MAIADYNTLVQRFGADEANKLSQTLADQGKNVQGYQQPQQTQQSQPQNTGYINATGAGDHHKNITTGQSWQDSLGIFATDKNAYNQELTRVQGLISSGTAPDMDAAKDWLGKLQGINHQPVIQQGQFNAQSYIDQLNNAKRDATIAQLGKSRDQAISNLNQERAGVAPRYYDQRNATASANQQQSRNFAEFMASRGSTNAGSNAQANLMQSMSLQGNLGTLGRQEQATYDDLDRRGSDVRNAYEYDLTSTTAGIEAQRMEHLINQMNLDRQFGLQEAGLTGNYGSGRTLQGQQFDYSMDPNNPSNQMTQYQLDQLMNPNSITNQSNQLALEASRLGNEQLRRQIEQIGKQPALTDYDRQMQSLQLEQAKVQLDNLKNQSNAGASGMTQQQINAYNSLMDAALTGGNNPLEQTLSFMMSPQGKKNAMDHGLTEGLYNQFINELQGRLPKEPDPMKSGDYKTNPEFANDYQYVLSKGYGAVKELTDNAQAFIATYGLDGYEYLLKAAQGGY